MVGLSLKPGQVPADGLGAGDRVQVVAIPPGQDPAGASIAQPRVLTVAEVFAVRPDPSDAGATLVTVVVPAEAGPRLAAHAAAGRAGVVKVARR
jgi:hypothetical protein